MRRSVWLLVSLGLLVPLATSLSRADDHDASHYHHTEFARTRRIVFEVVDKILTLHVDGAQLTRGACVDAAVEGLVHELGPRGGLHILEGDSKAALRRVVMRLPQGDLDACLDLLDRSLPECTANEMWQLTDVLVRGALNATGDAFSQLMDQRMMSQLALQVTGERPRSYGFTVAEKGGAWTVEHVFAGYDAEEQGLREGDTIAEIAHRPTCLMSEDEVEAAIRDVKPLDLRIYRDGFRDTCEITLHARTPRDPNVTWQLLPGKVAYFHVRGFVSETKDSLEAVLEYVEDEGATAMILDLRDNMGGDVNECLGVAGLFLGPGKAVYSTSLRTGQDVAALATLTPAGAAHLPRAPMLVLVNERTASASEMLAGALRDQGRARLIGVRTFGKGVGQTTIPIAAAEGERFLLMSTMRYLTPSGYAPDRTGLVPDDEVAQLRYSPAEEEQVLELWAKDEFKYYVDGYPGRAKAQELLKVAEDDGGTTSSYPEYAQWLRAIEKVNPTIHLSPVVLRRELRKAVRNWARDQGKVFRTDLRDDFQLQRAYNLLLRPGEGVDAEQIVAHRTEPPFVVVSPLLFLPVGTAGDGAAPKRNQFR